MSKKDYQAIARAFHSVRGDVERGATDPGVILTVIQNKIMNILESDNPRLSRERFIEACETGQCKGMRA